MDYQFLVEHLKDNLGSTPLSVLVSLIEHGEIDRDGTTITADTSIILQSLEQQEGKSVSKSTLRKRLQIINQAAKDEDEILLNIKSRDSGGQPRLILTLGKLGIGLLQTQDAAKDVKRSTDADTKLDTTNIVPPQVYDPDALPTYKVFVSHAHEDNEVEKIVSGFCTRLSKKLAAAPHRFSEKFSVKLWVDHKNMAGIGDFSEQTDEECLSSHLGLFLLSDFWHKSPACQQEAGFFTENSDRLLVQLSGNWQNNPGNYLKAPIFPKQWKTEYTTLLEIWALGTAEKDAFVDHLRDEICWQIEAFHDGDRPSKPARPNLRKSQGHKKSVKGKTALVKNLTRIGGPETHDQAVLEGKIQPPEVREEEDQRATTNAIDLLMDWATGESSSNRVYAVLGSFGAGKTTTMQVFAQSLLKAHEADNSMPFPVYLDLRDLADAYRHDADAPGLLEIIRRSLRGEVRDTADINAILETLQTKPCVVIFDGLDEVGTRIGTERIGTLYRELMEIVPINAWLNDAKLENTDWKSCPTRILVTCRDHFFRSNMQEKAILSDHDRNAGLQKKGKYQPLKTVYMAPFTADQIRDYFIDHLGEDQGSRLYHSLCDGRNLDELAEKPLMAHYIAEIADDLQRDIENDQVINAGRIYELLFQRALARDSDKKPLLTTNDRHTLLTALAGHMWVKAQAALKADELEDWLDDYATCQPGLRLTLQGAGADGRHRLQTELRNASLLIREKDDAFRFVHTSFFEYFLALHILKLIEANKLPEDHPLSRISRETLLFLFDIVDTQNCWSNFNTSVDAMLTKERPLEVRRFSVLIRDALASTNRELLPIPDDADLSDLDLSGKRWMRGTHFRNVTFGGTNLGRSLFEEVTFESCNFSETLMENATFDNCGFVDCTGKAAPAPSACANNCHAKTNNDRAILEVIGLRTKLIPGTVQCVLPIHENAQILFNRLSAASSAVFAPDGKTILTASGDSTARLFDTRTAREIKRFEGHQGMVMSAVFAPDGKTILTASGDSTARLFDTRTAREIKRFEGHQDWVMSA
ncbi:MAG: NACHT domain-containing protein, partial [Hyphomicrobiales bacterium]|nr:NACHT domain-containing protein [Hyphomicrobiales bacterium]